ncbi:hypothetical protein [Nocardia wallacei]|uniref:hypothetical protein n=1 Tax=Nocardia wallacei TaxID=480035 RepID=UPI002457809F|nr:hypothetical protein [Nocardia wallacei]
MTTHPPTGPAREQALTAPALAAIVAEIARRAPHVRYVEFDWAAYGGLDAHAFLDARGAEVKAPGLAGDLAQWSTDLRSPDLAGMVPISSHGPFLLDLHTSHPTPAPPPRPDPAPAEDGSTTPVTVLDASCPVLVGDEVTFADRPALRGEVVEVFFREGLLECTVRTASGERVPVRPWELLPAAGASDQWRDRMHALQRGHATALVRQRAHALAERADALSRKLAALARDLWQEHLPDHGDDTTTELDARDFDEALDELRELRAELAAADLIRAD